MTALNASTVGSYLYNAFEQRVQKVASSTTTQQVYDRFGHLLEDANASGVVQKEYIWLDDLPVAMVDDTGASPVVYFIHTDQLGTPQKITDASAQVVWDGVADPFGNAVTISSLWGSPTLWGSFTWEPTTPEAINLRFPGQYYDAETALNQNWFRDYDSSIGRYVQADPLGVDAGINLYAYVGSDPMGETDPGGLAAVTPECIAFRALGQCLWNCTKEHYLGTASAAVTVGAGARVLPYPGAALGGGTGGTSFASIVLRRVFPQALETGALGTRVLGGILGRAVPYLGWGLLAYDVGAIGVCTKNCMDKK